MVFGEGGFRCGIVRLGPFRRRCGRCGPLSLVGFVGVTVCWVVGHRGVYGSCSCRRALARWRPRRRSLATSLGRSGQPWPRARSRATWVFGHGDGSRKPPGSGANNAAGHDNLPVKGLHELVGLGREGARSPSIEPSDAHEQRHVQHEHQH